MRRVPGAASTFAEFMSYPAAWASRWRTVARGGPAAASKLDRALLDGDLRRPRGEQLGHRRQREPTCRIAVAVQRAGPPHHRGRDGRDGPVGEDVECAHRCEPSEDASVHTDMPRRRLSMTSAPRATPPVARKPAATASAPGLIDIASIALAFSRFTVSRRAGRRVPQCARSTRRATSNWSRPWGTTHTGTPRASAFCVAPIPPCVMAHTVRPKIAPCGTKPTAVALRGTVRPAGTPKG